MPHGLWIASVRDNSIQSLSCPARCGKIQTLLNGCADNIGYEKIIQVFLNALDQQCHELLFNLRVRHQPDVAVDGLVGVKFFDHQGVPEIGFHSQCGTRKKVWWWIGGVIMVAVIFNPLAFWFFAHGYSSLRSGLSRARRISAGSLFANY